MSLLTRKSRAGSIRRRHRPAHVAVAVDAERFLAEFMRRLTTLAAATEKTGR